jgi:pyruvate dehydrogenase E2 component (dihydrolipoamide acetyltransferase)
MADVTMPRLSDTMEEGTIAAWLKKPGEQVNKGDVIAQIETDKATMDLTVFEAGTLQEILAPEGTTVQIGKPVARIGSGDAAAPAAKPAPEAQPAPEAEPAPKAQPAPEAEPAPEPEPAPKREEPAVDEESSADGKVRASPMARHMAAEHGLDLAAIQGTGPQGRVVRADIEAALAAGTSAGTRPHEAPPDQKPTEAAEARPDQPKPTPVTQADGDERVQLSQMRRTIARRMAESTRTIPHFFLTITVDATELVALRKQVLAQLADEGVKVSINDLVVKGAALALRKVPEANVSFAEDALIRRQHVNIGIAVATERGLIVPVVRDADTKALSQIARETRDLAERANAGKLQPPDYSGGTFTVSNLGMFGIEQFNAVINPPEAAILAVGAITREPVEFQGEIALRERMKLTLSVDHRALDGAAGARYLQALKALLEKPLLLLV